MTLVHGQVIRPSVNLASTGEDDLGCRIVFSAGFEHRELRTAVDFEIRVRIAHAVDVAHLAGEVEDHLAIPHEHVHDALVAHIGVVHPYRVFDAIDVERIAAVVGNQRVDDQDVGARGDELTGEVTADETETAGDHDGPVAVEVVG